MEIKFDGLIFFETQISFTHPTQQNRWSPDPQQSEVTDSQVMA